MDLENQLFEVFKKLRKKEAAFYFHSIRTRKATFNLTLRRDQVIDDSILKDRIGKFLKKVIRPTI